MNTPMTPKHTPKRAGASRPGRRKRGELSKSLNIKDLDESLAKIIAEDPRRLRMDLKAYVTLALETFHRHYVPQLEKLYGQIEAGKVGPEQLAELVEKLGRKG